MSMLLHPLLGAAGSPQVLSATGYITCEFLDRGSMPVSLGPDICIVRAQ